MPEHPKTTAKYYGHHWYLMPGGKDIYALNDDGESVRWCLTIDGRSNPTIEGELKRVTCLAWCAPDLLAALKAVRTLLHDELLRHIDDRATRSEADAILEQIDAVIARVEAE